MLKALGYSASPPNRIRSSVSLTHPYVHIGSKRHEIKITPDYLVEKDGKKFFVLDAKAPDEEVFHGKNVEQAYSYAIHPNIRVRYYALCNGRDFVLYDVSKDSHILSFSLSKISEYVDLLVHLIGPRASMSRLDFRPDWGHYLLESRRAFAQDGKKYRQIHLAVKFHSVGNVNDDLYTFQSVLSNEEGSEFLATFDFEPPLLEEFFHNLELQGIIPSIRHFLRSQPYLWYDENHKGIVGVVAEIGDHAHKDQEENYIPMRVTSFLPGRDK